MQSNIKKDRTTTTKNRENEVAKKNHGNCDWNIITINQCK